MPDAYPTRRTRKSAIATGRNGGSLSRRGRWGEAAVFVLQVHVNLLQTRDPMSDGLCEILPSMVSLL